jgi:phosphoenolpyruvate-protein phosphotransferase (PTS system enzyme I)
MLTGIAVSKGISIGEAYILDRSKLCVLKQAIDSSDIDREVARFRIAIETTKKQMQETKQKASKVAEKYSIILDTYTLLLDDDILVNDTITAIRKTKINAEWAITETLKKSLLLFDNINDDYLKGKTDDLELVVHGVIKNLLGHSQNALADIQRPVILITHTLSPADTISIPREYVLGLATEAGGKTSHVGIFASALGIPSVVGIKTLTDKINTGDQIIIDGINGNVITNPTKNTLEYYKSKQTEHKKYEKKLLINIGSPAITKDGFRVSLMANIESTYEINSLKKFGAEGVGLYRTEFLYLNAHSFPSESVLYMNFKNAVQEISPYPIVIRTLDIGMDKQPAFLGNNTEENPALGLRGIRMSLAYPEQFSVQIRAILRASFHGEVKIMYPMISDAQEIIQANSILEKTKEEMRVKKIPFNEDIEIGAMIETPSSAICCDQILKEVDFVSIGTNDLVQYILAVDRVNEQVAHLYQPYNPVILKTLKNVFDSAQEAGKKISICGELGGDPLITLFLLGLGNLGSLSMDPHSIPHVKKIICQSNLNEAREFSKQLLKLNTTNDIHCFLNREMRERYPLDFQENPI